MKTYTYYILCLLTAALAHRAEAAHSNDHQPPLVRCTDRPFSIENGLDGRHVALWGSHGLYYELGDARWTWQRARLNQTVEDLFPTSYVVPFLTPMLENAGANVLMPRERDTNPHMVVVDNDGFLSTGTYSEHNGHEAWRDGDTFGFGFRREMYTESQNPFVDGTFREIKTTTKADCASKATWKADIEADGRYAVYVSYKTLKNNADDAHYTVRHKGGETHFLVNQTMSGGTWVYLGTFAFAKGGEASVELSNLSAHHDRIVTADGVRFGGGMGNVARRADGTRYYDNTKLRKGKATSTPLTDSSKMADIPYTTSGYPRFAEGARYYLQWAGIPESVYSLSDGTNDYTDDYKCRGEWVNFMSGGSSAWPKGKGLRVPIDVAMAFHTDGGTVDGDSIIGTLGIYDTKEYNGKFGDGSSRSGNKELCTEVYNAILKDIRATAEPNWHGRGMRDSKYYEAYSPHVPTLLLELLSHESFAEMRYGLDPRFKFTVSRAIYKGILRYLSRRKGFRYVVQPLPVDQVSALMDDAGQVHLTWHPVTDPLESTATPDRYVVYQRIGDGDFDHGRVVDQPSFTCHIPADKVVSFRIHALNAGGQSMPSEIVSVGKSSADDGRPVLVINGFDRISAPDDFRSADDRLAGFLADSDNGVADGQDASYVGRQKEYRRAIPWTDDDSPGFGASMADEEGHVIAGNTHDYAAVHGRAIMDAGHSFVSVSRSAVPQLLVDEEIADTIGDTIVVMPTPSLATRYSAIDLILGKQKQTKYGRPGASAILYKTFDDDMQRLLTLYSNQGGRIFVSGSYVGTDLWQNPLVESKAADKAFSQRILKYKWRDEKASTSGKVLHVGSPMGVSDGSFHYFNRPNPTSYGVESPDAIIPAGRDAFTFLRYADTRQSAAVAFGGSNSEPWRCVTMGFPFESIVEEGTRTALMRQVLDFLLR